MPDAIDIEELKGLLTDKGGITLLDVRRKADYEAAPKRIPGARWRDPETVEDWAGELPAGKRTVVYCVKGGPVSGSTAENLRNKGLDAVILKGGLKAWEEKGEPVTAP